MTSNLATVETAQAKKLSDFDSLGEQIAIARQNAAGLYFDYDTKEGNKAARSHVADLRKLNAKIEKARKEAKAVHLERGRNVDDAAKGLAEQVARLIEPHDKAIKAIEAAEQERVAALRRVLDRLSQLAYGVSTSEQAEENIKAARSVDTSSFEEFEEEAASLRSRVLNVLQETHAALKLQEEQQAELQRLRAEAAEREQRDREEALRLEGERRAAEQLARQRQAERDQAELRERQARERAEEAERRERATAERLAEADRHKQAMAEQLMEAQRQEQEQEQRQAEAQRQQAARAERLEEDFLRLFDSEIESCKMNPHQLGECILDGKFLGGSVAVNWEVFERLVTER